MSYQELADFDANSGADEEEREDRELLHEEEEAHAIKEAREGFFGWRECDPPDACRTHGRCWIHSEWEEDS